MGFLHLVAVALRRHPHHDFLRHPILCSFCPSTPNVLHPPSPMTSPASRINTPEVLRKRKCYLHIDLDCFFAQVESIRLGLPPEVPLVSQQWNAIIAVNYSARKFGITRLHHNVFDAKQLCPELVCAHVATLGPGDSQPDYYPAPSRYTHKVSLDPYRKASARIFSVFSKFCLKSQKGGLDEVFMDVTDIVNQRIMDEYGQDLSKWDRDSAEQINWTRDHPHAGYVFGAPKEGGTTTISSIGHDSEDEDEDEDGEGRTLVAEEYLEEGLEDIPVGDEFEEDDEASGSAVETHGQDAPKKPEAEEEDEFDLDLEHLINSEFDTTFSQQGDVSSAPHTTTNVDRAGHEQQQQIQQHQHRPLPQDTQPGTENSEPATAEKTEEELRLEKEAEDERLRAELEQLRPYYGIPEDTFEEQFWGEMQMLKAAEFCNEVRQAVKDELGYTCSAGISSNKLLAKLGSGMNKPFAQTIILPRYIPNLLHGIKLSKIRNLGGKFGSQVKADYNIQRASQLWPIPLRTLQERYGDQAGLELWQWTRGIDHVGIRKIKSKSMCSHKSFIPALSDMEEIQFWISSTCLELVSRIEAEYEETERWPRTISLGFYGGKKAAQDQQESDRTSSFRAPHKGSRSMPLGSRFEYGGVEGMARKMYATVEKLVRESETGGGRPILPLILLTVTVSNFAGGKGSALGDITKFFSKAPLAPLQTEQSTVQKQQQTQSETEEKTKNVKEEESLYPTSILKAVDPKRQMEKAVAMQRRKRFFNPETFPVQEATSNHRRACSPVHDIGSIGTDAERSVTRSSTASAAPPQSPPLAQLDGDRPTGAMESQAPATLLCDQCSGGPRLIPIGDWEQHQDFHFALKIQQEDRQEHHLARQQQQQVHAAATTTSSGNHGSKRNASSSSSSLSMSSNGGKRKKQTAASAASSTPLLSKFFKPSS